MIPRTLVPHGSRPPAADTPSQRRRPTTLDERTLVPAMLPIVQLDGHSNIPKTLPLESISARVVVPRDVEPEAYRSVEDNSVPLQPTDLDARIAIPQGVAPPEKIEPPLVAPPADLVDLDVFMTGEVNLLVKPQTERKTKWDLITRVSSVAFHIVVIALILLQTKLFPAHAPTQEQIDLASRQLTWIPPESSYSPKPTPQPKVAPPPVVHVDPKVLRDVAPPIPEPAPKPKPKVELPDAPVPKEQAAPQPQEQQPVVKPEAPKPTPSLEVPDMPKPREGLVLPRSTVRDAMNDALKTPGQNNGGKSGAMIGPGPRAASPGGGVSGPGQGSFGNGYQILTDLQGVDFSDYMQRMLETVRRNWYAVMPQSAMLGERGRVMLRFHINADGSVPNGDPLREMSSGKEPLDRAAVSSIRSSNPFEPLPPAFIEAAKRNGQGTFIEIRIIFLYNLPIEAAYQ